MPTIHPISSIDSPFQSILHTNTTPTAIECEKIRDLLVGPREESESLTKEIARMQIDLDQLARKRHELNEFIDAHLSLLSPMRRLPTDVMRLIFAETLPSGRNSSMAPEDAPLLLCQVCREWRYLAYSIPRMWSSLHMAVPAPSRVYDLADIVTAWLSRSGIIPLSLSITPSKACTSETDAAPLLLAVAAFSRRWSHLSITLPIFDDFRPLKSLSAQAVPILTTVLLDISSQRSSGSAFRRTHARWKSLKFLKASSLFSVSIGVGGSMADFSDLRFPSKQMVHLKIHGRRILFLFSYDTALGILQQCPALETCYLDLSGEATDLRGSLPNVVLSRLWHFGLGFASPDRDVAELFSKLSLPVLRSLEYNTDFGPSISGLPLPISGLAPTLQRLNLDICMFDDGIMSNLLRSTELLQFLQISGNLKNAPGSADTSAFLLEHFGPTSDGLLCPSLRDLSLRRVDISDDALLAIIKARAGSDRTHLSRLTHLRAELVRKMQRDIMPELQPFVEAGLDVALTYNPPSSNSYSPREGIVDRWMPADTSEFGE
ncbi:hypothetical protein B0H11DRAFT_1864179 [Mycena galericulata]|nr:hypothetical protein B0H11DRAFT_1864179 [Mycena galericulata]